MAHRDMIELRWPSIAIGALRTWLDLQLAPPGRDCHAATTGRHPQKELAPAQAQRDHHVVTAAGFSS